MDLYLKIQRLRYQRGNLAVKKRMLDDFCETNGYHRGTAIKIIANSWFLILQPFRPQEAYKNQVALLLEVLPL